MKTKPEIGDLWYYHPYDALLLVLDFGEDSLGIYIVVQNLCTGKAGKYGFTDIRQFSLLATAKGLSEKKSCAKV